MSYLQHQLFINQLLVWPNPVIEGVTYLLIAHRVKFNVTVDEAQCYQDEHVIAYSKDCTLL